MITLIVRSIVVYIILLVVIRIMGKRQVGELQPFELVITLVIADLACIPMAESSVPLLHGVIPLITLLTVHFLLSFISRKNVAFRRIVCGNPTVIIDEEGVNFEALKTLNMNVSDIEEAMRSKGIFCFEDVYSMILETNGTFSILPVEAVTPVCIEDTEIKKNQTALSTVVISGGKLHKENMKMMGIDKDFIEKALKMVKLNSIKDITLANIDTNGKMYIKPSNGPYILHKTGYVSEGG